MNYPQRTVFWRRRDRPLSICFGVNRMQRKALALGGLSIAERVEALHAEALEIQAEDVASNEAMGAAGGDFSMSLYPHKKALNILTHCNTGALATAGLGTALGVIRTLHTRKQLAHVWVDETRPYYRAHAARGNAKKTGCRAR